MSSIKYNFYKNKIFDYYKKDCFYLQLKIIKNNF